METALLKRLPEAGCPEYCRDVAAGCTAGKICSLPFQLSGDEITLEKLEALLWLFAEGKLTRLEWSWPCTLPEGAEQGSPPQRSLVFLKEPAGYACLFFDNYRAQSFALLARPDLYGKEKGIEFVPFHQGKLFRHDVHRGFTTIRRQLTRVFSQVSWPNGVQHHMGSRGIWGWAENVAHGRQKYNVDKQMLGGFAPESAQNSQDARFYFYTYPDTAVWTDSEGKTETLAVGELNRDRLQQVMVQFLGGVWPRLQLTWSSGLEKFRHIVLLHEEGRFMLAWIDEAKRQVEFHVATYMDVEGKKYPKAVFQGRTVGAYLVHDGAKALRNALELLLANLDDPTRVINKFAEYAEEKPVKARPYEEIRANLAGGIDGI